MQLATTILILLLGPMLGSFACCQAWRLRYKQTKKGTLGKWSVCLSCGHKLAWWENLPIISWLLLRGKCSKCGQPIGIMELFSEIILLVLFALLLLHAWPSLWLSPTEIALRPLFQLLALLVLTTILLILFLYDARWREMPTSMLYLSILVAVIFRALAGVPSWPNLLLALLILPGVYFLLYIFSREKLVGAGDYLLCITLALILGHWWLALLTLFLANALATLIMLPLSYKTKSHILPLAPFLIAATFVVYLTQSFFLNLLPGTL